MLVILLKLFRLKSDTKICKDRISLPKIRFHIFGQEIFEFTFPIDFSHETIERKFVKDFILGEFFKDFFYVRNFILRILFRNFVSLTSLGSTV